MNMRIERQFIGGRLNGQFNPIEEERIAVEDQHPMWTERYLLHSFHLKGQEYKAFVISTMTKEAAENTLHQHYHIPTTKNHEILIPKRKFSEVTLTEDDAL